MFTVAAFFNAVLSDIVGRSVSFFMDRCSKFIAQSMEDKTIQDLQLLLLRVRVILEQAEGRHITNQAMAHLLNMLRKEMYRGYFTIDTIRCQCIETTDHDVSYSFALSVFKPTKRIFLSNGDTRGAKDLQQVLDNLNNIMIHVSEFVTFLNKCPPLCRQPYSMHLFVGKCMFGRQMEMDRIMDFLMQMENPSTKSIGVLPIVGPTCVGKRTLVANVCGDARVCNYFSKIFVLSGDDISGENFATLKDQRLLVIIEFSRDVDEAVWNNFYLFSAMWLATGSKMVITSRSNKIRKFGTTPALVLNFLPPEAFWYFFKILAFGSVDSSDYPKLESIAMEMARGMKGSFTAANITSSFLRNNITTQHWSLSLTLFRANIQRNVCLFGESPCDLIRNNRDTLFLVNKDESLVCSPYRACLAEDNVPSLTMYDFVSGTVNCEGTFDVLAWKSHIPPYKYYAITCTRLQSF